MDRGHQCATRAAGQPASWYPDNASPGSVRYWDGANWVGPPQLPNLQYGIPAPYAGPGRHGRVPTGSVMETASGDWFGPSGWWRRAGGYILDALVVGVSLNLFELVVSLAVYGKAWGFVSLGSGRAAVGAPWLRIAMSILSAGVTSAYAVWLIGRRRQTLGMQAVGITVIDPSGRALTRRQVWLRGLYWLLFVELASLVVSTVQVLDGQHGVKRGVAAGSLLPLACTLVVYLWPLGNGRNQTLIDKAAGSVVVRGNHLGAGAH